MLNKVHVPCMVHFHELRTFVGFKVSCTSSSWNQIKYEIARCYGVTLKEFEVIGDVSEANSEPSSGITPSIIKITAANKLHILQD